MNKNLLFLLFLFFSSIVFPQQINNVAFSPSKNNIEITYDLIGDLTEQYEISILLRREEYSGFVFSPRLVSGDIGRGIIPGNKHKIIWDYTKEYHIDENVTDYYFEVKAVKISSGIPWYYYIGTAVLGGGTAAGLLLNKKKGAQSAQNLSVGTPPGRPQ